MSGKDAAGGKGQPTWQDVVDATNQRNMMKRAFDKADAELKQCRQELDHLKRTSTDATRRVEALDAALSNSETGINVVVLYQAEALWAQGQGVMSGVLGEVRGRLEAEEQQAHLQTFIAEQRERIAAAERAMKQAAAPHVSVKVEKDQLEKELAAAGGLFGFFKRRKLRAKLAALEEEGGPLEKARREAEEKLARLKNEEAPKFPGLSVAARRTVNLHLIAAAQYLYLEMVDDGVAGHVAKSHGTLPGDYTFGYSAECLKLLKAIADARARVETDADRATRIAARVAALETSVRFAKETDVLPAADSLEQIDASVAPRKTSGTAPGPKPAAVPSTSAFGQIMLGDGPAASPGTGNIVVGNPRCDVVAEDFCGLKGLLLA